MWVPPDGRPLPAGVLRLRNFDRSSLDTKQVVERSDAQYDEGQAERTMAGLRQRFHNTARSSCEAAEPAAKRAALRPVPKPESDDDSSEPARKKRKKGSSDESDDSQDKGDGIDFAKFSFPDAVPEKVNKDKKKKKDKKDKKEKTKGKDAGLKKGRKAVAAASPKKKGKKATAPGDKPPSTPKTSSGANVPEWRQRHNKQRRLQQIEQHLLSANQLIETFQSTPSKVVLSQVVRFVKLLAEALELDNSFMMCMQDESGLIQGESLDKVCGLQLACVHSMFPTCL